MSTCLASHSYGSSTPPKKLQRNDKCGQYAYEIYIYIRNKFFDLNIYIFVNHTSKNWEEFEPCAFLLPLLLSLQPCLSKAGRACEEPSSEGEHFHYPAKSRKLQMTQQLTPDSWLSLVKHRKTASVHTGQIANLQNWILNKCLLFPTTQ